MEIPLPGDDEIRADVLERMRTQPPLNIERALARVPECFGPWNDFVAAIYRCDFDPRLREVALCRFGFRANSPYEVLQHSALARGKGVTADELAAITTVGSLAGQSSDVRLICDAVDEFEGLATITDDTLTALIRRFGTDMTATLIVTLGHYACVVRVVNALRVPLESESPLTGQPSPTG